MSGASPGHRGRQQGDGSVAWGHRPHVPGPGCSLVQLQQAEALCLFLRQNRQRLKQHGKNLVDTGRTVGHLARGRIWRPGLRSDACAVAPFLGVGEPRMGQEGPSPGVVPQPQGMAQSVHFSTRLEILTLHMFPLKT